MCGITAILTLAGRSKSPQLAINHHRGNQNPSAPAISGHSHVQHDKQPSLRQQVDESLKFITHRGPDHSGSWASEDGLIGGLSHGDTSLVKEEADSWKPWVMLVSRSTI